MIRKDNIFKMPVNDNTEEQNENFQKNVSKKTAKTDSQVTEIVKNLKLFKDENNLTYIEVIDLDDDGFREIGKRIIKIRSDDFKEYMLDIFHQKYLRSLPENTMKALIYRLIHKAKMKGSLIEIFNRIGTDKSDDIFIDLANDARQSVRVNRNGWQVGNHQVVFTRYQHHGALPTPEPGGNLKDLLQFLPVESKHDQCLALCWLVASIVPDIERCFLLLEGPPGSAKSAVAKRLKALIDPSKGGSSLILGTKDSEVAQQLSQHCIPYYDNISTISGSISDLFCACFSNTNFSKKALYTDDETFTFNLSGNCIFSTIGLKKPRPDFLERTYKINFFKGLKYKSQKQLESQFNQMAPKLFGALLDTLVSVLNTIDQVPVPDEYRTVDFDHYCATAAEVLGYGQEFFWEARNNVEMNKTEDIIDSVPVIKALYSFLSRTGGYWRGCMSELLSCIKSFSDDPDRLPRAANSLSGAIKNASIEMRAAGMTVTELYNDRCRLYEITLDSYMDITTHSTQGSISGINEALDQLITCELQPCSMPDVNNGDTGDSELALPQGLGTSIQLSVGESISTLPPWTVEPSLEPASVEFLHLSLPTGSIKPSPSPLNVVPIDDPARDDIEDNPFLRI